MCAVELLRVSVHDRISAAAEDFLLQVEKEEEAAEIPALRALLTERLTVAAEEIVGLFEQTVTEYEERVERLEREICRQRRLLDAVLKPEVRLHRADFQVPVEQQEPEPPHIKEEQEGLWSSEEVEQLPGLEEADGTKFTASPVKSEDDEEKPQSSQLYHSHTEDNRETEPLTSSSTQHMETGAEEEDSGGPQADRSCLDSTETETDVSDDELMDTRKLQSALNSKVSASELRCRTGEKPFSCSECAKTFRHSYLLKRHMRTHTGEKPFICSFCGKRFSQKGNMMYHMGRHTGEKRFSCSVCDRRFTWLSGVKRHKCVHDAVPEADREDCGGSEQARNSDSSEPEAEDNDDVWQEIREPDPGNTGDTWMEPLSCFKCGKMFDFKKNLLTHMRSHTAQKPFSCSVCQKHFSWSDSLQKHMKIHKEEKPFSCSLCGKTFIQKGNLQVHMRSHTGEKPFSCSVCHKGFTQRSHLLDHMRCHTGEKPFSCSICKKRYRFRGGFRRHMKIHMGETIQVPQEITSEVPSQIP